MLVQELRRMKKIISESNVTSEKSNEQEQCKTLNEAELRAIIEEEIAQLTKEMNLTSGWVYGDKKPQNSKKGYINTSFAGPGFK